MKSISIFSIALAWATVLTSCNSKESTFDASGSFEAEETIISSESSGTLKAFSIEEGDVLKAGQNIGYIDSTQLHLKKKQLQAQIKALQSRKPNIPVQLAAVEAQLQNAEKEKKRIENLIKGNAATTKQLDDIEANIAVLTKQMQAQKTTLESSSYSINKDVDQFKVQIEQINDQLKRCQLTSPMAGTVLAKYSEENEMAAPGKALYKMADLRNILLRTYISGDQLPQVQLNQKVTVATDDGKGGFKETEGTIIWINDKSEFTPKTIQTKNERANMVYAVKIKVANDGSYKIGMYGEIKFQ